MLRKQGNAALAAELDQLCREKMQSDEKPEAEPSDDKDGAEYDDILKISADVDYGSDDEGSPPDRAEEEEEQEEGQADEESDDDY